MLGRLVLILLQFAGAWWGAPQIMRHIPLKGDLTVLALALVFAILVFLIGILGAEVLKDVARPSSTSLTWSLGLALVGAVLTLVPQIWQYIPWRFDRQLVPLAGALLGYHLKR